MLTVIPIVNKSLAPELAQNARQIVTLRRVRCQATQTHEAATNLQEIDVELEFTSDTGRCISVLLQTAIVYRSTSCYQFRLLLKEYAKTAFHIPLNVPAPERKHHISEVCELKASLGVSVKA